MSPVLKTGLEILDLGVTGIEMEDKGMMRAEISWAGAPVKRRWSRTELCQILVFTGRANQGECEGAAKGRIKCKS